MSPVQWQRVCQLVDVLASVPPDQQQRMLQESTEETIVRAEAEKLLGRISSVGHFLSKPLAGLSEIRRFEPGMRIADRFLIQRFIGAGGMGEVYEAFDEQLQVKSALKTVLGVWVDDPRMMDLFRREVQVARRVTHPNVVRIYDIGEHRGDLARAFFSMELIEGRTMAHGLAEKRWDKPTIETLLHQIAKGVAEAHNLGVVHRDLKPANVLVRDADPPVAVVTDFGLARLVEQSQVRPGSQTGAGPSRHDGAGTPAYMAPECFAGSPATAASDVYSFGLIAYEAFTGQLPFGHLPLMGALVSRGRSRPPLDGAAARAISPKWRAIILKCLEPDPARRLAGQGRA